MRDEGVWVEKRPAETAAAAAGSAAAAFERVTGGWEEVAIRGNACGNGSGSG